MTSTSEHLTWIQNRYSDFENELDFYKNFAEYIIVQLKAMDV